MLEAEVAHQGADDLAAHRPVGKTVLGDHIQEPIAVDQLPFAIDHQHTVAVAVEGDAQIGVFLQDRSAQGLRVGGADIAVDIETVRIGTDADDLGAELLEDIGRRVVGRAIGAIDHDLETAKVHARRNGALAELDVAPVGVVDPLHLAERGRVDGAQRPLEFRLDCFFDVVRKLIAIGREELDAVVLIGVMRCGDDDTGRGAKGPCEIGHTGRGHRPEQPDVCPRRHQARLQGRLEHVARDPRIFSDQNLPAIPVALAEDPSRRPTELQDEVRSDHPLPDAPADPVRPEITTSRHTDLRA